MATPHLSPYVSHGELVFLSGQLAIGADGLIQGDAHAQTLQCLRNIEAALGALGLPAEAVLKTTVWLTSPDDFESFNRAYAQFFGAHRPARSTTIAGLALPGALVEIEAVAANPQPTELGGPENQSKSST